MMTESETDWRLLSYVGLLVISIVADAVLVSTALYAFMVPATFSIIMSGALVALRLSTAAMTDAKQTTEPTVEEIDAVAHAIRDKCAELEVRREVDPDPMWWSREYAIAAITALRSISNGP